MSKKYNNKNIKPLNKLHENKISYIITAYQVKIKY